MRSNRNVTPIICKPYGTSYAAWYVHRLDNNPEKATATDHRYTSHGIPISDRRVSGGHPLLLFASVMLGAVRFFSGDPALSVARDAALSMPPHPLPSSVPAPASMSAPAVVGAGESGPYVPVLREVLPGGMSGFGAEGVAVDEREKCCQASLSMPGVADMMAVDAVAILDSGSGIKTTSAGIARKLPTAFPNVQVVEDMSCPSKLKVAFVRVLAVQEKTCLVRIALHPSAGVWSPWIRFLSPSCRGTTMLSLLETQP